MQLGVSAWKEAASEVVAFDYEVKVSARCPPTHESVYQVHTATEHCYLLMDQPPELAVC